MAIKDRVIEIAYKLKDQFTAGTKKITGSLKRVEGEYEKSASRINRITRRIGSVAATAGKTLAAGVGVGLTALGVRLASMSRDIDKLAKDSRKLGVPIEQFQKLGYAAKLSGVSQQQLSTGLQRMTRRIAEAATGTGVAVDALDSLGISIDDIAGKSPDQQFEIIAEAMSKVPSQAERVRIGFKLFDTEGVNLINLMNDGAEGVRKMGAELEKMGAIVDEKTAKQIERLNDSMTRLSANTDAMILRFGPDILEALNRSLSGLGLAAERGIGNISLELKELYERRRELMEDINQGPQERGLLDALFGDSFAEKQDQLLVTEARIRELLDEVKRQTTATDNARESSDELAKSTEGLGKKAEETKGSVEEEKDEIIKHNTALEAAKKKVDEYKKAKEQANDVKLEFEEFVNDVGGGKDEPPDYIDASYERRKAQNALDTGDYDEAIDRARSAAEMVRQIGESGEYSNFEIKSLAKTISNIASEAADRKAEATLIDGDKERAEIDQVKQALSNVPATIDQASLSQSIQQAIQQAQAEANKTPIVVKVQTINETNHNGVRGYSDGTDYVETESRKRGTRPQ